MAKRGRTRKVVLDLKARIDDGETLTDIIRADPSIDEDIVAEYIDRFCQRTTAAKTTTSSKAKATRASGTGKRTVRKHGCQSGPISSGSHFSRTAALLRQRKAN